MHRTGRWLPGELSPNHKLTMEQARAIRAEYAAGGVTQTELAERYGMGQSAISDLLLGRSWKEREPRTPLDAALARLDLNASEGVRQEIRRAVGRRATTAYQA
jgi:hypothetical protein